MIQVITDHINVNIDPLILTHYLRVFQLCPPHPLPVYNFKRPVAGEPVF